MYSSSFAKDPEASDVKDRGTWMRANKLISSDRLKDIVCLPGLTDTVSAEMVHLFKVL